MQAPGEATSLTFRGTPEATSLAFQSSPETTSRNEQRSDPAATSLAGDIRGASLIEATFTKGRDAANVIVHGSGVGAAPTRSITLRELFSGSDASGRHMRLSPP